MKKYIVIALIVLVGGALLIGPLMRGGGTDPETGNNGSNGIVRNNTPTTPAYFTVRDNIITVASSQAPIEITVSEKGIASMTASLDGNVLQTWQNPTANVTLDFISEKVGTFGLTLDMTMTDGKTYQDRHSIRILSDIPSKHMQASSVKTYPHSVERFTQGLEFNEGKLFESTGLNGKSGIFEINLENGEEIRKIQLDGTYFGEGITMFNDVIYQLTWKGERCFTYNFKGQEGFTMRPEEYQYLGQGWGLCNDGKELIMSNGSEYITFRNPENFQETHKIQVYNEEGPVTQLNELEYIDGKIYANVYMTNFVVVIDPVTGKVLEQIDCQQLALEGRGSGDVLNGIAHNPANGKIYMTGKNWPKLFEVTFSEVLP